MKRDFLIQADFDPTGDQPEAIRQLCAGLAKGRKFQTLEGVTGSGKTFTIANTIARHGRPTLVLSHNKTLAAQLYAELKTFFPNNAVEYFISYYDYYQPEAYIPQTDTFIEKDSSINEEIERLRLAATDALLNREDVIIVASVSCIYGLGSPEDYKEMVVSADVGESANRDAVLKKLVDIQYERNDYEPGPGRFRVRGDTLDIFPSYAKDYAIRLEFWGDEIDSIRKIDPLTGHALDSFEHIMVSPAKHFVMPQTKIDAALVAIRQEMEEQIQVFEKENRLIEAQRIKMRTEYDLELLKEIGFCGGIENYSRHLAGRSAGDRPECLLDYFPGDFLTIIDESHVTLPQIRGMYNGDQSRKRTLVEHGFRLPSALDNRPMNFEEFIAVTHEIIFLSATPGPYEIEHGGQPVEQIIRPTGIIDPPVELRPLKNQIDDLMEEIRIRAERGERTLVTTLTKRTAEDLSEYLEKTGLKVQYLHSDIDALERVDILRELRSGKVDCLIGINLLREGLDLPEVSLVAILDADKEGFLRSETALIQTAGRAARHIDGLVIMYADHMTDSMQRMLDKCDLRRAKQAAYNREHGIVPKAIKKQIQDSLKTIYESAEETVELAVAETGADYDVNEVIRQLEKEMLEAAEALEFERAAALRDQIKELKR
ncbi:MAG: excinuclease ABC subunit UvrB [Pontiellaceae bacterium]|nr:excinuclease ABC subunit UvrB [Pontiellaceae bacterium]MBN2786085.1 excinuclease ABC subunit UvrB [Pontiellaceae bacterium]